MEKLSAEKRTEVSKMSTERLRARLIKTGYDEDEVFEMDRSELISTYAAYLLSPRYPSHLRRHCTYDFNSNVEQ